MPKLQKKGLLQGEKISSRSELGSVSPRRQKKDQVEFDLVFFQLNPPVAEEIHLRWMKSLRDEICLASG